MPVARLGVRVWRGAEEWHGAGAVRRGAGGTARCKRSAEREARRKPKKLQSQRNCRAKKLQSQRNCRAKEPKKLLGSARCCWRVRKEAKIKR